MSAKRRNHFNSFEDLYGSKENIISRENLLFLYEKQLASRGTLSLRKELIKAAA